MSIQEKEDIAVECHEHGLPPSCSLSAEHPDGELLALDIRPAAERQLVRTIDRCLLPVLIFIYFMNYIDRAAITSARLKGLEQDLGLTDIQYQTVLAMLYVSYIPAQVPSNITLNRISRPSYYIAACVVCWGLTSALTGATNSYAGIVATRLFIGLPEAAFYPGGIYLLSRWYTKKELAFRTSIFSAGASISSACGSGSITIVIGVLAAFLLPDYPHNTRWLSPAQRRLAQVRLAEDGGEADEDGGTDSVLKGFLMAIRDPKVLVFALMACCLLIGTGFANFFPTIAATLGFSTTMTLLLAAIPYVFATFLSCLNAWHADHTGERYFHIAGSYGLVFFGYVLAISTMSVPGRYIAMFLMTGGASGYTLISAWVATSVPRPPAKRSAAIAIVNATGNIGTLVSSFVWNVQWDPEYHPSMFIGMAGLGLGVFLATVIRYLLARQNKIFEREEIRSLMNAENWGIEEAARSDGTTYEEELKPRMGFRYLL
ncbi:MFS general substrate transporter [Lentinus brumalis]|uniref:MFS general substrate transporter n=1 Tax=Lentinus brumalis TaxID=2498619 RepID=A0A371DNC0_9APHY|nr:MFS general substrate transporter [Polyporus brumalis]